MTTFTKDYECVPLIYGDTDSLYSSYGSLLQTIEGIEDMTYEQKREIVLRISLEFLDDHNKEFIAEYYKKRNAKSVHKFELETISKVGVWLDTKKHYAQLLTYKDGHYFPEDHLKLKVTGIECVKSSTPTLGREFLRSFLTYMLGLPNDNKLIHKLNIRVQEMLKQWLAADVEDICENYKVSNYSKWVIDDVNDTVFAPKSPWTVKGLARYNYIRQKYNLSGEPQYGGKMKIYKYNEGRNEYYMAFLAGTHQDWMEKYAPIDKKGMFQKCVLDPINRIVVPAGMPELHIDGSIQFSLF